MSASHVRPLATLLTYIVRCTPVSKLVREDVQYLPPAPSLLAPSFVRKMVRLYSPQLILKVVWWRPGMIRRDDRSWRWFKILPLHYWWRLNNGESHNRGWKMATFKHPRKDAR